MLYGGKFRWAGSIDEFKKSKDPYVFQFRNGKLDGPMQPKDIQELCVEALEIQQLVFPYQEEF